MQTSSKQTRMSNEANAINKNKDAKISYRFTHRFFHPDQAEIRNRLKITIDLLGIECMLSAESHIHVAGLYRCNFPRRYPVLPPSPSAEEQWVVDEQEQTSRWEPHGLFNERLCPRATLLCLKMESEGFSSLSAAVLLLPSCCFGQINKTTNFWNLGPTKNR